MSVRVDRYTVTDVSKDRGASVFRVKRCRFLITTTQMSQRNACLSNTCVAQSDSLRPTKTSATQTRVSLCETVTQSELNIAIPHPAADRIPVRDRRFRSPPQSPDRSWGPPSFLFNGQSGRGVKVTIHLHVVPRFKIGEATPLLVGRDSSVGIATRYGLEGPGIESRWGRDFPLPLRPALGPTPPPIQWISGLSRG